MLFYFHPNKVLKPGGLLFFRDYGLYDHAMLRFSPANKLSDNFYVRQDGTRAYYFSKGKLKSSFHLCPFHKFTSSLFVPLTFISKKIYVFACVYFTITCWQLKEERHNSNRGLLGRGVYQRGRCFRQRCFIERRTLFNRGLD